MSEDSYDPTSYVLKSAPFIDVFGEMGFKFVQHDLVRPLQILSDVLSSNMWFGPSQRPQCRLNQCPL